MQFSIFKTKFELTNALKGAIHWQKEEKTVFKFKLIIF